MSPYRSNISTQTKVQSARCRDAKCYRLSVIGYHQGNQSPPVSQRLIATNYFCARANAPSLLGVVGGRVSHGIWPSGRSVVRGVAEQKAQKEFGLRLARTPCSRNSEVVARRLKGAWGSGCSSCGAVGAGTGEPACLAMRSWSWVPRAAGR